MSGKQSNKGSIALAACVAARGDQKRLAEEMRGDGLSVDESRVCRFVSGERKPNTAERLWLLEHRGIPLLDWDEERQPDHARSGEHQAADADSTEAAG